MVQKKQNAFTLVELIVVIVILSILATIAFLSFSSQTASSRDSVRLSDLSNIAKGLSIYNAVSGKYPSPDSPVPLTASGTLLGYQGNAGTSVLKIINLSSNGGRDPLDKAFYTYRVNSSYSKMQIMGFLEDGNNMNLSYLPYSEITGYAATDYSKRYAYSKGEPLGVVLSSGTLIPIQDTGSGVDISSTGSFTLQIDNKTKVSGSGSILSLALNNDGLVGYWSFDEGSGAIARDWTSSRNDGIFTGGVVFTGGKSGYGITTSADTGRVLINFNPSIIMGDFTLSVWVNFTDFNNWYEHIIHTSNSNGISFIGKGSCYAPNNNKISFYLQQNDQYTRSTILNGSGAGSVISTGVWHNIIVNRSGQNAKMLVDGVVDQTTSYYNPIVYTGTTWALLNQYDNPSLPQKLDGSIDELRIYNRSLSDSEMKNLYDSLK